MKKLVLFIFIFLLTNSLKSQTVHDLLYDKDIYIVLLYPNNSFYGQILIEKGNINSIYPLSNTTFTINTDEIVIYTEKHQFLRNRKNITYRDFLFPKRYKINITLTQIQDYLSSNEQYLKILIDTDNIYLTTCQAIIVEDSKVFDKPSVYGKQIGEVKKGIEIVLYEELKTVEINEKDWYKIKLEKNEFGWILKSCAKIYFENEYGGARDKIEILKSINQ